MPLGDGVQDLESERMAEVEKGFVLAVFNVVSLLVGCETGM